MHIAAQRDALAAQVEAYKQEIRDLIAYLQSPKFHDDTTVQVADVIRRLREAEQAAGGAA